MATPPTSLAFPLSSFTQLPVDTEPTATNIRQLKKEVFQNAMAIPSTHGGGDHGHLGLVMSAADYANVPGTAAFVVPANAPTLNIGAAAGPVLIATRTATYERDLKAYTTAKSVEHELKKMFLEAAPEVYIASQGYALFGYANVSLQDLLQHLVDTHGTIDEDALAKNLEDMGRPWDPNTPTITVFNQARKCRDFATAGGDAISDANAIRICLEAFQKSGVMDEAIKDWRKLPTANRTWANMPAHFLNANKERLRTITTSAAGFQTANAATPAVCPPTTNSSSTVRIGDCTMYYCFSHGLGKNPEHTSATCSNPREGHKREATADNMMGGINTIRRRRGERPAFGNRT